MSKTIGELRVRIDFNASNLSTVDNLKIKTAELIDAVYALVAPDGLTPNEINEFNRLKSIAMTGYEEAAHWAVKAATTKKV